MSSERMKVAIVGSGVSGLAAVWSLNTSTDHEVHLFEAGDRIGGHTNPVPIEAGGIKREVDTGFIVLNTATYPNFIKFLKEINVNTVDTEMTFSISRDRGAFEWAGTSLQTVFAQPSNIIRPQMWRMLFDIVRFNVFALDLLDQYDLVKEGHAELERLSIHEYLEREGYSAAFRDDYLYPLTGSVWSTGPEKATLDFPALTLIRFMWNHHLLSTFAPRAPWLTINGSSRRYIDAVLRNFPKDNVHLSSPIESVSKNDDGQWSLKWTKGGVVQESKFDKVILACHGDQACRIMRQSATAAELDTLEKFKTTSNVVYLHNDASLMPKRREVFAAWNYITKTVNPNDESNPFVPTLSYYMNILQHFPVDVFGDVIVTMNPPQAPHPKLTQARIEYRHPIYNQETVRAQQRLESMQNSRGIGYAGAWTGYGFHEDGFTSGVLAAQRLGGRGGWTDTRVRMRPRQRTLADTFIREFVILILLFCRRLSWLLGLFQTKSKSKGE